MPEASPGFVTCSRGRARPRQAVAAGIPAGGRHALALRPAGAGAAHPARGQEPELPQARPPREPCQEISGSKRLPWSLGCSCVTGMQPVLLSGASQLRPLVGCLLNTLACMRHVWTDDRWQRRLQGLLRRCRVDAAGVARGAGGGGCQPAVRPGASAASVFRPLGGDLPDLPRVLRRRTACDKVRAEVTRPAWLSCRRRRR